MIGTWFQSGTFDTPISCNMAMKNDGRDTKCVIKRTDTKKAPLAIMLTRFYGKKYNLTK